MLIVVLNIVNFYILCFRRRMEHFSQLRAGFKKMGNQTIIIVCWMEESRRDAFQVMQVANLQQHWRETVKFNDSSECRINLTEEDKSFYLTILFNGSITKLTGPSLHTQSIAILIRFKWFAYTIYCRWSHICRSSYRDPLFSEDETSDSKLLGRQVDEEWLESWVLAALHKSWW